MTELYFSVDIEADGPIPGEYSMLSLGAAAFLIDDSGARIVGTWSSNLEPLSTAKQDDDTMKWWSTQTEAWEIVQKDREDPANSIKRFVEWVKGLCLETGTKPVFVAYPAGFDFTFVYWYTIKFAGECPFSFSSLDMKSYAMAKLGTKFRETTKKTMPDEWFKHENKRPHVALEDAIEQGWTFVEMMKARIESKI